MGYYGSKITDCEAAGGRGKVGEDTKRHLKCCRSMVLMNLSLEGQQNSSLGVSYTLRKTKTRRAKNYDILSLNLTTARKRK